MINQCFNFCGTSPATNQSVIVASQYAYMYTKTLYNLLWRKSPVAWWRLRKTRLVWPWQIILLYVNLLHVEISTGVCTCRKGVCRNVQFPHGCLDVSYRSWNKSNKPCPCRDCTFPNLVHHQNLESTRPAASCFPGPEDAPRWEMCDFLMGVGSCYIAFMHLKDGGTVKKIAWYCPICLRQSPFVEAYLICSMNTRVKLGVSCAGLAINLNLY